MNTRECLRRSGLVEGCDGVSVGSVAVVAMAVRSRAILAGRDVVCVCRAGCSARLGWFATVGRCVWRDASTRVAEEAAPRARKVEAAGNAGSVWCGPGCARFMWEYMAPLVRKAAEHEGHLATCSVGGSRRGALGGVPLCTPTCCTVHSLPWDTTVAPAPAGRWAGGDRGATAGGAVSGAGGSCQRAQWEAR